MEPTDESLRLDKCPSPCGSCKPCKSGCYPACVLIFEYSLARFNSLCLEDKLSEIEKYLPKKTDISMERLHDAICAAVDRISELEDYIEKCLDTPPSERSDLDAEGRSLLSK